ncbi:unnamed protein product [Mytilus edulis]|uniref:Uncharacterized protein n=1 Tax=Mytilus edulis TaxID=6550 RepID=A0A8S3QV31_MYTED|nr:unnamed protein product [Mytilus edulis]
MILKLDTLLELRDKEQITNKYVFSRPVPSTKPYRGSDVLREIKGMVCLKQSEAFTFTALRKHIATLTQLYEINDTMQYQLAQFIGHDIRVHREYYRLPLDIIQKAKIAKFLIDASEGEKQDFENLQIRNDVTLGELSIPALDIFFKNPSTHTLKKLIFVEDNGPSEASASTLKELSRSTHKVDKASWFFESFGLKPSSLKLTILHLVNKDGQPVGACIWRK